MASLAVLLAVPVFGQSAAPAAFELADVHPSAPTSNLNPQMRGGAIRDGRYELHNATMVDLIRTAYTVEADKVLGGPSWLELDRFDVIAKVPAAATPEAAKLMLQTLLADRFKLAIQQDKREMTTWVLSVATGGPKLLRAEAPVAATCQGQPAPPNVKGVCRNMTLGGFAELLPRVASTYVSGTITDTTGLTGPWDFDIVFTNNRAQLAELGSEGVSLFDALEKQLGLKLEQKTITTTGLVVSSVNRTPTPNSPEVAKALPPPPAPEFEVAEIKPTPPGNQQPQARILPSGQINAVAVPLIDMLYLAWGINNNPELISGPKWIQDSRFDIVGKAFSGATAAQFIDNDVLSTMLRALLIDRFQIKTHFEERPVSAYVLSAGNVKMTKADPSTRTKCFEGPAPGGKDPRIANPSRTRLLTCQNVTMAQFAERLRGLAAGYVRTVVTDTTGLEGGWNFTLNFSPIGMFPGGVGGVGGRAAGDGPAAAAPAAPTGAITLPEALDGQLGLKLEMKQRPLPVLVIDQISEKPTGN